MTWNTKKLISMLAKTLFIGFLPHTDTQSNKPLLHCIS